MVGLLHTSLPIYGAIYRTGTIPAVTAFDLVSILYGDLGGLTTSPEPRGAALPGGPGAFRQAFPAGGVEDLLARHRQAMEFLRGRGLSWKRLTASSFESDFRHGMARQRRAFLSAPLRHTVLAIVRSATNSFPNVGPLANQPGVEDEIQRALHPIPG
jgi:hypothetical protein